MISDTPRRKQRVAIIGSGLAGLTAAHLLTRGKHAGESNDDDDIEVHIFEKSHSIGMDSASIDVAGDDGKIHRVDSPMRAVQGGYYTHLLELYKSIGVQLEKSNFTYSFFELSSSSFSSEEDRQHTGNSGYGSHHHHHHHHQASNGYSQCNGYVQEKKRTTFIYNGSNGLSLKPIGFPLNDFNLEYTIRHLFFMNIFYYFYDIFKTIIKSTFFASCYICLTIISFYHVYFTSNTKLNSTHPISKMTFSQFLSNNKLNLPKSFINEILIPLFSCVATCSPEEILNYPISEILEYIAKTFGSNHFIVKGGVKNVVKGLLLNINKDNIHLGCELVSLRRILNYHNSTQDGGEIGREKKDYTLELKESSGKKWEFDNVIFATQANQARFLLADYYKALRDSEHPLVSSNELRLEKERLDALGDFNYTQSIVVNHYDSSNTLVNSISDRRILNLARWSHEDIKSISTWKEKEDEKLNGNNTNNLKLSKEYIMATHDLSILHPNCKSSSSSSSNGTPLLQTTNPTVKIKKDTIISSQIFERAIMTLKSKETLKEFLKYPTSSRNNNNNNSSNSNDDNDGITTYQGLGGIYFVGSWAAEGIPLLEGCVVSAERAVDSLLACR